MTEQEIRNIDFFTVNVDGILPQCRPFVLIDRLLGFSYARTATVLQIREDNIFVWSDGCMAPGGVIENVAQTCAARIGFINKYIDLRPVSTGYICAIRDFNILRLPKVGETIKTVIDVTDELMGNIVVVAATVSCGNETLAKGSMTIALASAEASGPLSSP